MRVLLLAKPAAGRHVMASGGVLAAVDLPDSDQVHQLARALVEDLADSPDHKRHALSATGEVVITQAGRRFALMRGERAGGSFVACATFREFELEFGATGTVDLQPVEPAEGPILQ